MSDEKPTPLPADRALPAPGDESAATVLDMSNGDASVKLDSLGPLVVNADGTVARIGNWLQMTDIERKNTLRVLGKRNAQRLAVLRGETGESKGDGPAKDGEGSTGDKA